jgi:hydrogenase-4 component F
VGIALALLGNFFLAVAATPPDGGAPPLLLHELTARGGALNHDWLKVAFIFLIVGYGTKMGLAPLHTWLPDAHSEAPSVVSALLSGALLNCAFLGILRGYQVCAAAGQEAFARGLLLGFGLASIAVAAAFVIGQADYKRLLAYSSVDHMGILALGVGLGGAGAFGAMLHAVNHSLAKAMMFLVAGNILAAYRTKAAAEVRGVLRALPVSGPLWLAAFFAISAVPPSGLFLSEFTILKAALDQGRPLVAAAYLALLAAIFIGMATAVLRMAQGAPGGAAAGRRREPFLAVLPPAALGVLVLLLGVHVPAAVENALEQAARALGGH